MMNFIMYRINWYNNLFNGRTFSLGKWIGESFQEIWILNIILEKIMIKCSKRLVFVLLYLWQGLKG
jgi:hypothetical protein